MTTRQQVAWMTLCLVAGASVRMFINERPAVEDAYFGVLSFAQWSLVLSPIVFLFAAVRIFFHEKAAIAAGLIGSILALPTPLLLERSLRMMGLSWWTSFNMSPAEFGGVPAVAPWLIVSVTACTLVLLLSITRLLPMRYEWRGVPLAQRSWPAITLTLLALATWYAASVSPYRIPIIVDASYPDIRVLHVTKRGFRFEETSVALYRDSRVWKNQYSRHLFQYQFPTYQTVAVARPNLSLRLRRLLDSPELRADMPIEKLHSWNAEGWYLTGGKVLAFTSDNGRPAPPELINLFKEIDGLPTIENSSGEARDICFGFCYDPWAGLGSIYINQRCRWSPDGKTRTCL